MMKNDPEGVVLHMAQSICKRLADMPTAKLYRETLHEYEGYYLSWATVQAVDSGLVEELTDDGFTAIHNLFAQYYAV
jgi:hypothetical protein